MLNCDVLSFANGERATSSLKSGLRCKLQLKHLRALTLLLRLKLRCNKGKNDVATRKRNHRAALWTRNAVRKHYPKSDVISR